MQLSVTILLYRGGPGWCIPCQSALVLTTTPPIPIIPGTSHLFGWKDLPHRWSCLHKTFWQMLHFLFTWPLNLAIFALLDILGEKCSHSNHYVHLHNQKRFWVAHKCEAISVSTMYTPFRTPLYMQVKLFVQDYWTFPWAWWEEMAYWFHSCCSTKTCILALSCL